ncbi:MAG: FmdB family zinc ribbon protein [Planctomycetota bacterium]
MPTYDYVCDACNHQFEEFQSMKDAALTVCPKCNVSKLRRLIGTGAGIIFKGSGFYQTDYKKSSEGTAKPAADGASKTSDKPASDATPSSADDKSCGSCGKTGPDVCD